MAEKKEKQYLSDNAQLMAEWDWEKNNELGLNPQSLTLKSGKYAYWKCNTCSRFWYARIADRTSGKGCKSCSAKKVNARTLSHKINRGGSLFDVSPQLAQQWHPMKNLELTPQNITPQSNWKVWWRGECGHEWQASVNHRFNGQGCPFCSGQKVLVGFNDLMSKNPDIARQWNQSKNINLSPTQVTDHSGKKVWWICEKGHEWRATIASRCSYNSGCPECSKGLRTSFPEQVIYYYIKKYFPDAIWSYRGEELQGIECDVFIPTLKIGVEYDGAHWHKNIERDKEKDNLCKQCGISLIRIREPRCPEYETEALIYNLRDLSSDSLESTLFEILKHLHIDSPTIGLADDFSKIQELITHTALDNSLEQRFPQVSYEWNYDRNGPLRPEHVSAFSNKSVWWRCKKGHEWQASISNRVQGRGCPVCSGKAVLVGFNDFASRYPELLTEWNYEKNSLLPTEITFGSAKKIWWKCKARHEWQAAVATRIKGHGCPYCNGLYASEENNLGISNPALVKEWNYDKNAGCSPKNVTPGSSRKVWWLCSNCGHEWQASIYKRNLKGQGCPECAKVKRRKNNG